MIQFLKDFQIYSAEQMILKTSEILYVVCHSCLLEKGFGEYDVLKNNCEDFAIYCKTGLLVGLAAVGSGVYNCYSRLTSDIGVRRDVAKVTVEVVEMVVGPPPPPTISAPSAPPPPISAPSAPLLD
ncbi:hypothetical protein Ddye_028209 [Dipteronia dyeriana]|uniref:LRAT domain-containing protein n=1 Tax=Dipteronia dyeriana TaxID=168575 RepID=A0AAD9TRH0_9ROSI|nr:hypothetical protein Ddye_028209 [Dipteronia dyeriana]